MTINSRFKNTVYFLMIIGNLGCQEKKNDLKIKNNNITLKSDNKTMEILTKQIKKGYKQIYTEPGLDVQREEFTDLEFNATIEIVKNILKSNGFIPLEKNVFNEKIKNIFDRIINPISEKKYLYVNYFNKCDREMNLYPNNQIDYYGIYIIKDEGFISDFYYLPEILNYQKLYPDAFKLEKTYNPSYKNQNSEDILISFWKDKPNVLKDQKENTQLIIARNMYLFNDSRAQFKWLILNDQYFMENLVKTFGYTDDPELLQWVIEKTKFDKNNPQDYGKLFWIKQCDGTLKIHANTFKVLQKLYTPEIANDMSNDIRFTLNNIKDYIEYLASHESYDLTKTEKVKIIANIGYFAEQYKYDKRFLSGLGDKSKMMGRLRNLLNKEDLDILKKNNYFNLPKFKEWWENADYDEYFIDPEQVWGRDNEPMTITEWRKQHPKK